MAHSSSEGYLDGQMLVAMPGVSDKRFARSVVLVCAHSPNGAMGIIVNRPAEKLDFKSLLVQLKIIAPDETTALAARFASTPVIVGGPEESNRGLVLHSADYVLNASTVPIGEQLCLTSTMDMLSAIARGNGPKDAVLAIGYVAWPSGQLESEILANQWLNCSPDHELIFGRDPDRKYDSAIRKLGIDLAMLSGQAGHG